MNPQPPPSLRDLFEHAITLPPADRTRMLAWVAERYPQYHDELAGMLQAHESSSGFLSQPVEPTPSLVAEMARPQAQEPGGQVGAYKLVRELGRGGMGTVYLAVRDDDAFRKTVALKIIRGDVANPDFVRRFKQERQILAALDHPNITRILDGGATDAGEPYFVMDYVDGMPIERFCDQHKLSVAERLNLVLQLADAVQYLHDNAIVHRDLKPSNVLVDKDGRVRLLDFGIAKVLSLFSAAGNVADGPTLIMTPGYASPEQLSGQPATKASDQYSLAVILYLLLTGQSPYVTAEGSPNLTAQLAGAAPPAPSQNLKNTELRTSQTEREFRKRVVGDLDRIVLKALQADPPRRYESVAAFARDLRNYLGGMPVTARPDSGLYRLNRLLGRNKAVAVLALLLMLLVAGGGVLGVMFYVQGIRIEAKQSEIDRLSEVLTTRLSGWSQAPEDGGPSLEQRVADVRRANRILTEDAPAILGSGRGDLSRLAKLIDGIVGYLDRVAGLSVNQAPVLKEVSSGYEQAGNLQAVVSPKAGWGDRAKAQQNYNKAATVVANAPGMDPEYLRSRLAQIDRRLNSIGSKLDDSALTGQLPSGPSAVETPAGEQPTAAPGAAGHSGSNVDSSRLNRESTSGPTRPSPPTGPGPTGPSEPTPEMADLIERLNVAVKLAERAKKNVLELKKRLNAQGQMVQGDIETSMRNVESYLQQARSAAGRNDVAGTRESLLQAEYTLKRVFRAVGN